MKELTMCDYYGMCDREHHVVGHICKVTKEYLDILSSEYSVSLMASPCIAAVLQNEKFEHTRSLKFDILIDEPFTLRKRLWDKVKILINLHECFRDQHNKNLFFCQVDFFFFLYVSLFYRNKRHTVYCLIYHQDFTAGRLKNVFDWFYKRALKKIDGVFYTQKEHPIQHVNAQWIPDYPYSDKLYLHYRQMVKQEKAVCLGTMNRYKQIDELVEVFSGKDYPLEIIGKFDDTVRYGKIKQRATSNILIENRVLSEEEYYQKLGEAKFSVLPYDMGQYINRTSGVLLESLYTGSIPIAPMELLEQNCLPGIGYGAIEEIASMELSEISDDMIECERQKVLKEFGEAQITEAFSRMFGKNHV